MTGRAACLPSGRSTGGGTRLLPWLKPYKRAIGYNAKSICGPTEEKIETLLFGSASLQVRAKAFEALRQMLTDLDPRHERSL